MMCVYMLCVCVWCIMIWSVERYDSSSLFLNIMIAGSL